ncbi:MAG: twin-arginine translocase TatA/TatE family subunit [Planctomycetes bacterium]|nr:twin-arginine translocase TatA/TatE family subunit [Planctomycetota bacterium]
MLGFIGSPGGMEMVVVLIIAVLLFGGRLPEVMKSLGKGIVEFRKGIQGVEDDGPKAPAARPSLPRVAEEEQRPEVPKFQPPA